MTNDSEKIEIAKKFLTGLRTADRSLLESIMAENVVWSMPGDSLISDDARGIEAVHRRAVAIVGQGMQFELKHERNRRMKLKGTTVMVLLACGLSASAQMVMDSSGTKFMQNMDASMKRMDQ